MSIIMKFRKQDGSIITQKEMFSPHKQVFPVGHMLFLPLTDPNKCEWHKITHSKVTEDSDNKVFDYTVIKNS